MKVLITGGGGFVGSHLADRLLADGHEVLVIDNYSTGRRDNLSEQEGLTVIEDTIADRDVVFSAFADFQPEAVAHAAASYKDPDAWYEDVATNAIGTANVVQAAKETGCERLVYFQTALCYGTAPTQQPVPLDHRIEPDSSYAISKTAGEQYIQMSGLDYVSLRLANVYGPRNISGPLPTFFSRLTDGKPCFVMDTRRDFVYIDDLQAVVLKALNGTGHGVYHVSSGSDVSIKELFDATIAAMGIELEDEVEIRERTADDAFTILLDPAQTETDFEWKAEAELEPGVAAAIDWYRNNGVSQTFTHLQVEELKVEEAETA